jgi:hypothetical protein
LRARLAADLQVEANQRRGGVDLEVQSVEIVVGARSEANDPLAFLLDEVFVTRRDDRWPAARGADDAAAS